MSQSSKTLIWIIIIVLVLIALVAYLGGQDAIQDDGNGGDMTEEIAPGERLTRAQEGDAIESFPREFLPFENITLENSYEIGYENDGVNQPVVEYTVDVPLGDVASTYRSMLIEGNWTITSDILADDGTAAFLYAKKDNDDVSITMSPDGESTHVIASYADRN